MPFSLKYAKIPKHTFGKDFFLGRMVTEIVILVKVMSISKKVVKVFKKYKNTPYSMEY